MLMRIMSPSVIVRTKSPSTMAWELPPPVRLVIVILAIFSDVLLCSFFACFVHVYYAFSVCAAAVKSLRKM